MRVRGRMQEERREGRKGEERQRENLSRKEKR